MYDAFISYSRANLQAVEALQRSVEARGLRVFLDLNSLRAGEDWKRQVTAGLHRSRMMVLCWSTDAAASKWVQAEIAYFTLAKKLVVPWLLDGTAPPIDEQGVSGPDPAPVVDLIALHRKRYKFRRSMAVSVGVIILSSAIWFGARVRGPEHFELRGHVFDQQGAPVAGAVVESRGVRSETDTAGYFLLNLSGSPNGDLQVTVQKHGFISRTIGTRADVPDLGVFLPKEP